MSDPTPRPRQSSETPTTVSTEVAPKTAPDLLLESEVFWEKYKTPVIAIVLIAVVGLVGSELYRHSRNKQLAEASAKLNAAKGVDDYKKVIAEHDDSLAAANAYLLIGRSQADAKDFVAAAESWKTFIDKFPQHPLAPNALMGQAGALEAQGKFDDARKLYQRVETDYAKSYLAPLASLAEAAMLKAQGKLDDAKRVYENVIAGSPQSDAARQATENLRLLKAVPTLPADAKPTPAASPASAAAPGAPAVLLPTPEASASPAAAPVIIPATQPTGSAAPAASPDAPPSPATTPVPSPAAEATPAVSPTSSPAVFAPSATPSANAVPALGAGATPLATAPVEVVPVATPAATPAIVVPAATPVAAPEPEASVAAPSPTP